MLQSHVVDVGGTFVGAAISTAGGFRFRAVHIKVEELDESFWRSLDDLRRAAAHLYTTGRLGSARAQTGLPVPLPPAPGAAPWTA